MRTYAPDDLSRTFVRIGRYNHRFGVKEIADFITGDSLPVICGIIGLRRTGKTTMMWHAMMGLPEEQRKQSLYIRMEAGDDMIDLENALERHAAEGCAIFFVDEITSLHDFSEKGASLADHYAEQGLRIVISGTDSLLLNIAGRSILFDRMIPVRTTWMPWREYMCLHGNGNGIHSFDDYLENGGILYSNMEEKADINVYTKTAIIDNLINSLDNNDNGRNYDELFELRNRGKLKNFILRVLNDNTHRFFANMLKDEIRMAEFETAAGIARKCFPNFSKENADALRELIKSRLGYTDREQGNPLPCSDEVKAVSEWLEIMDVFIPDPVKPKKEAAEFLLSQPALRWHQVLNVLEEISKDQAFTKALGLDLNEAPASLTSALKGEMLEDIILIDVKKTLKDHEIFSWRFPARSSSRQGEFDLVIMEKGKPGSCCVFEIKKSGFVNWEQAKNLRHAAFLEDFSERFGVPKHRAVLYRGPEFMDFDGIMHLNVEDFLLNLPDFQQWIEAKRKELEALRDRHDRCASAWIKKNMQEKGLLKQAEVYVMRNMPDREMPFADWLRKKGFALPPPDRIDCAANTAAELGYFGEKLSWTGFQQAVADYDKSQKETPFERWLKQETSRLSHVKRCKKQAHAKDKSGPMP